MKDCTECRPEFLCEEHFKARGGLPQPKELKKQSKVSVCEQGHRHIPVKGQCLICFHGKNQEPLSTFKIITL